MTRDALTRRLGELTDAVLGDPRWEQDDLSVSGRQEMLENIVNRYLR